LTHETALDTFRSLVELTRGREHQMKIKKIEHTNEKTVEKKDANGLKVKTRLKAGPTEGAVNVCG